MSLTNESEWTLSVFEDGLVVWENVAENDDPQRRCGLTRAESLRMAGVAAGNVQVDVEDWQPGYG